jgi:cellulose synthase/poly-beta-1,6-N-acetylglucosamine synthase-like glycosyltransferase
VEEVDAAFAMLATALCADISSFQRKQFENMSHTANKAMNLNAYIGLMGKSFRRRSRLKQDYLKLEKGPRPDLVVRTPDYVLTLDADSLIKPNYIRDMTAILESNPNLAVAQTPYLAFPGATTAVERFAGATTDIQYLVHQGSTYFNAGYWVGANALIRHSALQKLETIEQRDGKSVSIFIQDRTVIEDTGSTIDLLAKGFGVYNHNEPLAYSATPSDFGALCIQRKRWCNGGLIIVGDLLRALFKAPKGSMTPVSFVLRVYYLLSPVIGNLSLFLLMVRSRSDLAVTLAMVSAMAPYFLLYSLDLRRMGYRYRDVLPVMALNLLLLPVAFAGILESLFQLFTGRKTSFARTPKVEGRTGIPSIYLMFYVLLIAQMGFYTLQGLLSGDYWVSLTPFANGVLVSFGVLYFIGGRNAIFDTIAAIGFRKQSPVQRISSV